jgi:DNA-binding transcriptional LysR family regulator
MEDHRLKAFCLLAELKSFSKAAEAKFITQSAMSHLIKNLEEELGVKLVNRESKNISLTPAGRVFYQYAKRILGLYKEMENEVYNIATKVKGTLYIGATPTVAVYLLPQVLYEFLRRYPEVHVELSVDSTDKVIERLETGSIDLGVVEGKLKSRFLTTEEIAEDEIVVIASDDNPLARKEKVVPKELLSQPFIMPAKGSGLREFVEDFFRQLKLNPEKLRVCMTIDTPELIVQMVQAGRGIAFVSKWAAFRALREGSVRILPLNRKGLMRKFYLLTAEQEPSSPGVKRFREFLMEYRFFEPL